MTLTAPTRTSAPFAARSLLVTDAAGRDHVLTVVKAAFRAPFDGSAVVADPEPEIRAVPDRHDDRPGSIWRAPADLAPEKPGTEVLLLGHARHPAAYPDARWVDVTLAVEGDRTLLRKSLRVFGPRRWVRTGDAWEPSEPAPFEDTPLSWAWAFGGVVGDVPDARNPAGRGVAAEQAALAGEECHRIEYPDAVERAAAGFGALGASWEPRRSRRGTAPADDLAPHPPADRDPRHYCHAPDDQWIAQPLLGGETFIVTGVRSERAWTFTLPTLAPSVAWKVRGAVHAHAPHLDTVILDADAERVELVWRARFPAPRDAADLRWVQVGAAGSGPRAPERSIDREAHR